MKVVLDTNVIISGLLWKGPPSRILDLGKNGFFQICLTPKLLQEIEEVLHYDRLSIPLIMAGRQSKEIIESLEQSGTILPDPSRICIIKEDPTDNIVLGAALSHQADYIISGDKHLLQLKTFQNILILSPRQFLKVTKK